MSIRLLFERFFFNCWLFNLVGAHSLSIISSLSLELSTWTSFGGSGFSSAMAGWFTRGKRVLIYDWRLSVCNLGKALDWCKLRGLRVWMR